MTALPGNRYLGTVWLCVIKVTLFLYKTALLIVYQSLLHELENMSFCCIKQKTEVKCIEKSYFLP